MSLTIVPTMRLAQKRYGIGLRPMGLVTLIQFMRSPSCRVSWLQAKMDYLGLTDWRQWRKLMDNAGCHPRQRKNI